MKQQTDVTELIPKALGNYWFLFFGGVGGVAVLEFAYRQINVWAESLGNDCLAPLDVASSGSILAWCLSALLLLTAGISLLNSRLGKKYDDPAKGDVWFWTAFALILLSMDTQVQFRETLRSLLVYASGTPLHQDGAVWWMAVYSFVFGLIAIRLLLDMWAYFPAFLLFGGSILCMISAQLIKIEVIHVHVTATDLVVLRTSLEALAVILLFLSFLLFGRRQVLRDPEVALRWFAKVWNQSSPLKPEPVAAAPAAQAVAEAPVVEEPKEKPAAEAPPKPNRPAVPSRPVLLKTNDDDFTLLNAS